MVTAAQPLRKYPSFQNLKENYQIHKRLPTDPYLEPDESSPQTIILLWD
jgi:hypothetical protein